MAQGSNVLETANLNRMTTLRYSLFDFDAALNDFQVKYLMTKDSLLYDHKGAPRFRFPSCNGHNLHHKS